MRESALGNLPEVNTPSNKLGNVGLFTAFAARVTRAGLVAGTSVETELESLGVDLVDNSLDAVGPLLRIGHILAAAVTALGRPTIINVDVSDMSASPGAGGGSGTNTRTPDP